MSALKTIYVGMHDGVCAVTSEDGGSSWQQGPVTSLPHAAARLAASPVNPGRAYLAAYEAGVYRTDDGGKSWSHLESYPSDYAHSVLAHPTEGETLSTWAANRQRCTAPGTGARPGRNWRVLPGCRNRWTGDFMPPLATPTFGTCGWHPITRNGCTPASRWAAWSAPGTGDRAGGSCPA